MGDERGAGVNPSEWMADIGKAADELGYGVTRLEPRAVDLVHIDSGMEITIESVFLSGDWLRQTLVPRPHVSGQPTAREYEAHRRGGLM